MSKKRLSPRERWNQRYANLPKGARSEPLPYMLRCLPRLPRRGCALDVAAGLGRHSLLLARRGLHVDAVDISRKGLQIARNRARQTNLTDQIRFIVADIERPWLPQATYDVVVVLFFLYRPLFPLIKDRLAPGGWLVYESFTIDQETTPHSNRPIRRELMLQPGELRAAFAGLEILFYDEGDHHGKATARLLARRI